MTNSWDVLAGNRHQQLIEGEDITFNEILFPTIKKLIKTTSINKECIALDIGCGTGYLTNILSKCFNQITGIEPSYGSYLLAKEFNANKSNVKIEFISLEDFSRTSKEHFDSHFGL